MNGQLPRLQAELDFQRIQNLSRDEIVAEAQDVYGRWQDLLPDEKIQIVESVVQRVTVGSGEVSIDLAYLPSPSEIDGKGPRDPTPALPFAKARLTTSWKPAAYPKELKDLTDHLQKRRMDLGLRWKDVALQLGVDSTTLTNWTKKRTQPALRCLPRVIRWLGYDPTPEATTIGESLVRYRRASGMSQTELARHLKVDLSTLAPSVDRQNRPLMDT